MKSRFTLTEIRKDDGNAIYIKLRGSVKGECLELGPMMPSEASTLVVGDLYDVVLTKAQSSTHGNAGSATQATAQAIKTNRAGAPYAIDVRPLMQIKQVGGFWGQAVAVPMEGVEAWAHIKNGIALSDTQTLINGRIIVPGYELHLVDGRVLAVVSGFKLGCM